VIHFSDAEIERALREADDIVLLERGASRTSPSPALHSAG